MLQLFALACLLTAAAAQQRFYCNSSSADTIRQRDFYLITRRSGDTGYPPRLNCVFNAESDTAAFFVEIKSIKVSTAVLTISSSGRILFRGSSVQNHQSFITTTTKSLQVRFDSTGDYSYKAGVEIRVRSLDSKGCPPEWTYLYGNCFGTGDTSAQLNFVDSQKACNSMRSNLLQIPASYSGSIRSFVQMLPSNLRTQYTWIGLTDKTNFGRYMHYWLSGTRQISTSEISCVSTGSYRTCLPYERCGTMNYRVSQLTYTMYMSNCTARRVFACSMPTGGSSFFYTVPDDEDMTTVRPTVRRLNNVNLELSIVRIVAAVLLGLTVLAGVIVEILRRKRHRRARAAGAARVFVSAGSATTNVRRSPPPVNNRVPVPQPRVQSPEPQIPKYSSTPPPSYEAAVGVGFANYGFAK